MAGFRPRQADRIIHTTPATGYKAVTFRSSVADGVMSRFEPVFHKALMTGRPTEAGTGGCWFTVREDGKCLTARLGTTKLSNDVLMTMTVRPPPADGEPAQVEVNTQGMVDVVADGGADVHTQDIPKIIMFLADLERHIAWAWLSGIGHAGTKK